MPRALSLSGYLVFGSLLLLVVLAGIRLFARHEPGDTDAAMILVRERDPDALSLDVETGFLRIESGPLLWGVYDPGHLDEYGETIPLVPEPFQFDDPFELGIHEVTNDQYYEFLLAWTTRTEAPAPSYLVPGTWERRTSRPRAPRAYRRGQGNLPVTGIPVRAALEFCAWFREEQFGNDPDLVVDLPTAMEFVRAGRGDDLERNFPWGLERHRDDTVEGGSGVPRPPRTNLSGYALAVDDERIGYYDGIYGLVGNAAEWVHGDLGAGFCAAVGWSFEREGASGPELGAARSTPFGDDMIILESGSRRPHIGFRIVIRRAPSLPSFRLISEGTALHREPPEGSVLPPIREFTEDDSVEGEDEEYIGNRVAPVRFAEPVVRIGHAFEMARTEITQRQYLAFLLDVARERTPSEIASLLPGSFTRRHPMLERTAIRESEPDADAPVQIPFIGALGAPIRLEAGPNAAERFAYVYEPGEENYPVSAVTIAQVEAYAEWLRDKLGGARTSAYRIPTVGQYLLAGRGQAATRYPWGDDPNHPELVCLEFRYAGSRPASLLGRLGDRAADIVGLCGNVLDLVQDGRNGRYLLAGGCYVMPASACTLDSFLDASWYQVEVWYVDPEDEEEEEQLLPVRPVRFTGFRLVREPSIP